MADTKVSDLSAMTTPAVGDLFYVVDVSAGASGSKKITAANALNVVSNLTELTAPAADDEICVYDTSAGGVKKVAVANLASGSAANVTHYGATGDGSTDDTTAVRAAITAAGTSGAIYFPSGTYLITDRLDFGANVTVSGEGATLDFSSHTTVTGEASHMAFTGGITDLGVAQSGDEVAGNKTWDFAAAHGLLAGDVVVLWDTSNASYSSWSNEYQTRECLVVRKVNSATQIETCQGAIFDWAAADDNDPLIWDFGRWS